jgi:phage FluMu protein gp41
MPRKRKTTLRKMSPLARELAKIGNDQASLNRRLMNLTEKVAAAEHKASALDTFMVSDFAPEKAEG